MKRFCKFLSSQRYLEYLRKKALSEKPLPEWLELQYDIFSFAIMAVWGMLITLVLFLLSLPIGIKGISVALAVIAFAIGISIPVISIMSFPFLPNRFCLLGIMMDKITGNHVRNSKVELLDIVYRNTSLPTRSDEDFFDLDCFFDEEDLVQAVYLKYQLLQESHCPKSAEKREAFRFYDRLYCKTLPKCKSVNWIMTKQKSDLLDELIQLEPTAEFEIVYLRFSRYLQEIRPIEGWEYAEGVAELCEKINNLYP